MHNVQINNVCLLWLEVWISINIYEYEQGIPKDSVHTNETNLKESMMKACMVYEVAEWSELRSFLAWQMHVIH